MGLGARWRGCLDDPTPGATYELPLGPFPMVDRTATRERSYRFRDVRSCTMCGGEDFKTLGRRLDRSQGVRPRRKAGLSVAVVRCRQCGLISPSPLPVPESLATHYDVAPDEYWSSERVAAGPTFEREIAIAMDLLGHRGSRAPTALDIGAGLGTTLRALMDAGFDAVGIEPSATFRSAAVEHSGIDPDRIAELSIEDDEAVELWAATVPDGGFDLITFGAVLEHLVDPGRALERVLRWLAPGGVVHAEVPSARWLMSRVFNTYYTLRGTDFVTHLSPLHPPYHLYEFTVDSFARHGVRHGYEIAHQSWMVGDTFVPWPLDPVAKALMRWTATGLQLTVWLRKVADV